MTRPSLRTIVLLIGALLLTVALAMGMRSCTAARRAAAEADLARDRGQAAIESGRDAVNTIGSAAARETEIHGTVQEATHAIAQAPAGDSNDAADRAACRMRSYRDQPRCRALLDTRAD